MNESPYGGSAREPVGASVCPCARARVIQFSESKWMRGTEQSSGFLYNLRGTSSQMRVRRSIQTGEGKGGGPGSQVEENNSSF